MTLHRVAPGCFFTSEEDTPINAIVGKKTSVPTNTPKPYYRTSELDEIPDNFAERMRKFKRAEVRTEEREIITPNGFAVSIAFNKGAYMVIPKEDL
ncbi:hypothetical protein HOB76_08390 [Candidatus Woesearchaeota archaeon]|jgi:hypothetical protein|nr:hypothetical protein [Candidatus Woesearchaeota archaeon]